MIARRFGSTVQSVHPNFDSRAMTEIGFMRAGGLTMPASEFEESYERVEERALTATTEGGVQGEAEAALLATLREQLSALEAEAGPEQVLLVENVPGQDYPKTRNRTTTLIVAGENRPHFSWTIDPPLRISIWRPRGG